MPKQTKQDNEWPIRLRNASDVTFVITLTYAAFLVVALAILFFLTPTFLASSLAFNTIESTIGIELIFALIILLAFGIAWASDDNNKVD
jgi:hypothetical protein